MAISSNSLFHFTGNKHNLINIINDGYFKVLFCEENFSGLIHNQKTKDFGFVVPMVCFCDIPLSNIENHLNRYGGYAIGLKNDWASDKLNPVHYVNKQHYFIKNIATKIEKILESDEPEGDSDEIISIIDYIKPIERVEQVKGSSKLNLKPKRKALSHPIYEEKEWRYVPTPSIRRKKGINTLLSYNKWVAGKTIDYFNNELNETLPFRLEDITSILVSHDTEVAELAKIIENKCYESHTRSQIDAFKSRITSLEVLLDDI